MKKMIEETKQSSREGVTQRLNPEGFNGDWLLSR